MTNINTEKEYDEATSWLKFCTEQILKSIFTCLPATINSYDSSTKRATVKIALKIVKTNGDELTYPIITDVPIIFPATASYSIYFPLAEGDPILLMFSQRGLNDFKKTYEESSPTVGSFFSIVDAVGIVGFGQLTNSPVITDGISIQDANGNNYITLNDTTIDIKSTNINLTGVVTVNGNIIGNNDLTVNGSFYYPDGTLLPSDHKHGGVTTGAGETTGPIP